MAPKHNVAWKHDSVCEVRGGNSSHPGLQIAHHRTFQPTLFALTVSFLRSTFYYVPGLNKNLEETNVPVFYKDCSTSCLFGARVGLS